MSDLPDRATATGPFDNPMSRYRPARSSHRTRSHDSAHSEEHEGEGAYVAPIEHPLIPQGDAELGNTQNGLASLIAHLRAAGRFAYDSEFIGELTYIPKLCLIQVASSERIALSDP